MRSRYYWHAKLRLDSGYRGLTLFGIMAKLLSPDLEGRLLDALSHDDSDAAIAVMREYEPGWGDGKPGDPFNMPVNPVLFRLIMIATPPQIERFNEEQRRQLRAAAVMQEILGSERGSERWLPQDVPWTSRDEGLTAIRMCFFWARSAEDLVKAERLGYTKKRVLGDDHEADPGYARCPYCVSIRSRGFIDIHAEFEPGVKFPPFRGCTHPRYACRCDMEFR